MATVAERVAALLVALNALQGPGSGSLPGDPVFAAGASLSEQITSLADQLAAGSISEAQFVSVARSALAGGYMNAYLEGLGEIAPNAVVDATSMSRIEAMVDIQTAHLQDFATAIVNGSTVMPIETRAGLYEESLHQPFQAGRLAGAIFTSGLTASIEWDAQDDDETCEPCSSAGANGPYTADTLPGIPGYPFCDGGTRCRCEFIFSG